MAVVPDADSRLATAVAERMLQAVSEPIAVGPSTTIIVRATAGVAWSVEQDERIDLLEHAYLACRRAKATAPGTVVGYEYFLGEQAQRRQRTEEGLRRAITNDELRLFVQPEIDLRDGRVIGVEALIRWQHPTDGLLAPAAFLPDAEAALAAAHATAAEIAANSPLTVRGIKDVLDEQRTADVAASLRYVAAWNSAFLPSRDLKEAVTAMFEKRPPNFTGD